MSYNFERQRGKFPLLWNSVFGQKADIKIGSSFQEITVQNIDKLNVTNTNYKRSVDISTDWEPIEFVQGLNVVGGELVNIIAFKSYEITFDGIDDRLLASIKPKILFRFPGGADSVTRKEMFFTESIDENFRPFITKQQKHYFSQEKETPGLGQSDITTLHVGIYLRHDLNDKDKLGFKEDFEVKLNLLITNPYNYS